MFAVSSDPWIIYTSNIFAILGLRALYFVLVPFLEKLRYLKYGLSAVLTFAGLKMLLSDVFHVPLGYSLGVIIAILGITVFTSVRRKLPPV